MYGIFESFKNVTNMFLMRTLTGVNIVIYLYKTLLREGWGKQLINI